eukprot:TCALIF_00127-PA protein Name:"Similar to UNC79 Protein unc-79 homolog (Homo sapiens)" AED:0.02 eAED:0.04 QI:0/0/0/0.66/0.5/0.33/3/0/2591
MMMGTRAAAFTAKIKALQEAQMRLLQSQTPSGPNLNAPTGLELATTLKWFSTTLLNVLKDVPGQPLLMMKSKETDPERMALYPSLDYKGLYSSLLNFIDLIEFIPQGLYDFGKAYLNSICVLIPFLERELIDTLPYTVVGLFTVLPLSLSQDIVNVVCYHLIPFTISTKRPKDNVPLTHDMDADLENYASKSAGAILLMVFQYAKDNTALHRQITEALMTVKEDLVKDLFLVIAHGTPSSRMNAVNLLFYYWPSLNPTLYDLKAIIHKFNNSETWSPPFCSAPDCAGKGQALAVNICLDHTICLSHHPDRPPPAFYCRDCFLTIQRLVDRKDIAPMFQEINHPLQQVAVTCDNQKCKSMDKTAVAICFSQDCSSFHCTNNRPTRYCNQCNKINHQSRLTMDHIIHSKISSPWDMEQEIQNYFVKAVISLLQEAKPFGSNKEFEDAHRRTMQALDDSGEDIEDETALNERRLLSRYGVWLLVGLGTPTTDTCLATFGHMLSMLFQWFNATAYLPNDKTGSTLEKLKSEYIPEWLRKVYKSYPDVFVSCLLPNPPDYVKIGGHWDVVMPKIDHIREGLNSVFCLVPYDVITLEVWEKLMSHWMEVINKEVSKEEIVELKSIFCKIFDPDMSPLGFDAKEMYHFISKRFVKTSADVQQQALQWLQRLCLMNIHIPLEILFEMLNHGIDTLILDGKDIDENAPALLVENPTEYLTEESIATEPRPQSPGVLEEEPELVEKDPSLVSKEELNLMCYNLMIDVLSCQMELQDVELHIGLNGPCVNDILSLINRILATPWMEDINKCLTDSLDMDDLAEDEELGIRVVEELLTDLLQLIHVTIKNVIPLDVNDDSDEDMAEPSNFTVNSGADLDPRAASAMKKGPGLGQFMAVLTTMQSSAEKVKEVDDSSSVSSQEENEEPFELHIDDYAIPLQVVYHLLLRNTEIADPDMRFYLMDSVRLLSLNADVLQSAARKQKRLIHYCQEPLLTGVMWQILDASHSQVAHACVPLLLHATSLPGGADILWKSLDEDFNNEDWRTRFAAVEKISLILRFVEDKPIKKSHLLRSVLSHAFCCLIASTDDVNVHVSQKAILQLGTVHDTAIQLLLWCLENQFDTVPIDRPVILKRLNQLFNTMLDRHILSWVFFANRFDVIIGEIQAINDHKSETCIQRSGSTAASKRNSAMVAVATANPAVPSSFTSLRNRLQKPSENSNQVKSLASSLKYPYKRTVSAPAGMGLSTASKLFLQKQNFRTCAQGTYSRHQSVPLMLKTKHGKVMNDSGFTLNKQPSSAAMMGEESEYINVAAKTLDLDEIDKETLHLLVFLFTQFLSYSDYAKFPEEKQTKAHAATRCFQSLFSLIGYNEAERRFQVMPHKIRSTPTVNAFIANLPQVLDYNFEMGKKILLNSILILQKIPFPPRHASSWQNQTLMQESMLYQGCGFSLWYLEPSLRRNWLTAAMVIFYKYDFNCDTIIGEKTSGLVKIIIHTLAAHAHTCDRLDKPSFGMSARSRDLSQLSVADTSDNQGDTDTVCDPDTDFIIPFEDTLVGAEPEEKDVAENANTEKKKNKDNNSNKSLDEIDGARASTPAISPNKPGTKHSKPLSSLEMIRVEQGQGDKPPSSSEVRTPMANLFGFLPRPSGHQKAPTPSTHQITSEGLPAGWAMQLMSSGRTLFIDNTNQLTTWIDPRTGRPAEVKEHPHQHHFPTFESPPSPLSLMDVITVGNPINVDKEASNAPKPEIEAEPLKEPQEERLLPVGQHPPLKRYDRQNSRERIIDRVWQVFGSDPSHMESVPLIGETLSTDKIQVVASIHKQDSLCSDTGANDPSIETYIGTITHIRNGLASNNEGNQETNPLLQTEAKARQPITQAVENEGNKVAVPSASGTTLGATGSIPKETVPRKSSLKVKKQANNVDKQEGKVEIATNPSNKPKFKKRRRHGTSTLPETQVLEVNSKSSSICGGKARENSSSSLLAGHRDNPLLMKQSALRTGEESIVDRCSHCGAIKEEYTEEDIGLCIINLSTFISRDPALAAPLLPEILLVVSRIARTTQYSWELDSTAYIPGNSRSIARQFFRCVLHQLSTNGLFSKLFMMEMSETGRFKFFGTLVSCLIDFTELNPSFPLAQFMVEMSERKAVTILDFTLCLPNMVSYLKSVQFEQASNWSAVFAPCDLFFRRLWSVTGQQHMLTRPTTLTSTSAMTPGGLSAANMAKESNKAKAESSVRVTQLPSIGSLFHVMTSVLRMPGVNGNRGVLEPICKLVSYALQTTALTFPQLLSICHHLQVYNTAACDVMRNTLQDALDFLADVHTLSKVKNNARSHNKHTGLNEDTLGGMLKAALSQYVALEISKGNGRDGRTVNRYLPWLFNPPGNIATQGPREFLDCVSHIRLLSWLLLGAVNYTLRSSMNEANLCQPVPLEASCHIADHIQVILAGFAEQSKTSVVHMCSLFHAFILCQLWTVYLEQTIVLMPSKDDTQTLASSILLDFWGKVTPGILQLVSHSKVLAEMVNLHFLSLMEALMECHSTVLVKLMPAWTPVLFAYQSQLPDHVRVRLQAILDYKPSETTLNEQITTNTILVKWLQRLQFKMGQIEMQASNVTQFFTV